MRKLLVLALTALPTLADAAPPRDWLATSEILGYPLHERLTLEVDGDKVTGRLGDEKLEGTTQDGAIRFVAKSEDGSTVEVTGTLGAAGLDSRAVRTDADDPAHPLESAFSARPLPTRPPGPPRRHEFAPTTYHRRFSGETSPVLTLWPGDSVHTTTVDAGGADEKGPATTGASAAIWTSTRRSRVPPSTCPCPSRGRCCMPATDTPCRATAS